VFITLKHIWLTFRNDAVGRGRWDLLWEDIRILGGMNGTVGNE